MKVKVYGYARISTMKQHIERQITNIKSRYPDAVIIEEKYTGTTTDRPAWNKLRKQLHKGDTIIFDEVSRMSRSAEEGMKLYEELFDEGVNMIFIKEPHINSEVYRQKLQRQIEKVSGTGSEATDKLVNTIIEALHQYTIDLAKEQIRIAFETAQAEVDFLHQRTSEGVRRAMAEGKQVGRKAGSKYETKKSVEMKQKIRKMSKDFEGNMNDKETMETLRIARNTYYKYKREMLSK